MTGFDAFLPGLVKKNRLFSRAVFSVRQLFLVRIGEYQWVTTSILWNRKILVAPRRFRREPTLRRFQTNTFVVFQKQHSQKF
jgi:hypothetical protein